MNNCRMHWAFKGRQGLVGPGSPGLVGLGEPRTQIPNNGTRYRGICVRGYLGSPISGAIRMNLCSELPRGLKKKIEQVSHRSLLLSGI